VRPTPAPPARFPGTTPDRVVLQARLLLRLSVRGGRPLVSSVSDVTPLAHFAGPSE